MAAFAAWLPFVTVAQRQASPAQIIQAYKKLRKYPELFDSDRGWTRWIAPPLIEALDLYANSNGKNVSGFRSLLREEVPDVYSFPFVSDEFCKLFLEEVIPIRTNVSANHKKSVLVGRSTTTIRLGSRYTDRIR